MAGLLLPCCSFKFRSHLLACGQQSGVRSGGGGRGNVVGIRNQQRSWKGCADVEGGVRGAARGDTSQAVNSFTWTFATKVREPHAWGGGGRHNPPSRVWEPPFNICLNSSSTGRSGCKNTMYTGAFITHYRFSFCVWWSVFIPPSFIQWRWSHKAFKENQHHWLSLPVQSPRVAARRRDSFMSCTVQSYPWCETPAQTPLKRRRELRFFTDHGGMTAFHVQQPTAL